MPTTPKTLNVTEQHRLLAANCHEEYIKRTSKHPDLDIRAFREFSLFCERLRNKINKDKQCQAPQKP